MRLKKTFANIFLLIVSKSLKFYDNAYYHETKSLNLHTWRSYRLKDTVPFFLFCFGEIFYAKERNKVTQKKRTNYNNLQNIIF